MSSPTKIPASIDTPNRNKAVDSIIGASTKKFLLLNRECELIFEKTKADLILLCNKLELPSEGTEDQLRERILDDLIKRSSSTSSISDLLLYYY